MKGTIVYTPGSSYNYNYNNEGSYCTPGSRYIIIILTESLSYLFGCGLNFLIDLWDGLLQSSPLLQGQGDTCSTVYLLIHTTMYIQ